MKYKNFFKKIFFFIIFILFLFFIYFIYLFNKINNKFNNNLYKNYSPEIYSEILNFKCNKYYNKNKIIETLILSKYRKKNIIKKPGDFLIKDNCIYLFRRSFDFPDNKENKIYIKMIFNKNNKLISILDINNNKFINNINLDPQIINFSNFNNKHRLYKNRQSFPKTLIDILVLIEDKNYYYHYGINIFSIIRAIIKNIKNKKIVEGGSTITQQLIKNIFFNNKKSFIRKFNELFMSFIIEYKYSKDKIIELYLNEIFFGVIKGKEIFGFPIASLCYFNTPIEELDLNQQVVLISMIKGASFYNPYKNMNFLIKRRNFIFNKIKEHKIINNDLYNFLINQKILLNDNNLIENNYSFLNILKNNIKNNKLNYSNCKKIFSTMNLISQKSIYLSSIKSNNFFKKNKKIDDLEIAMIVINYKNGKIKSSIGGFNNKYIGFNRIYSKRQIGSIIKPIIYLYALNIPDKYQLNTLLLDMPIFYKQDNNVIWSPKNNNNNFKGKVKLIDSLIYSLNIPTINLGFDIGINNIIKIIKLSINNNKLIINKFPSIFLGALNLNLIDISQMYQSIINKGNFIKINSINKIIDKKNNLFKFNKIKKKIFSNESSYLILHCMKKVISKGTGLSINRDFKNLILAGKTGTTNKFKDNWFVGIDNEELCVIWIGKDNNSSINLNNFNCAIKVYKEYIKNSFPVSISVNKPKNIHYLNIDKLGNILCNKHNNCEKIPIWTKNYKNFTKSCPNHSIFIKYLNKFFNFY